MHPPFVCLFVIELFASFLFRNGNKQAVNLVNSSFNIQRHLFLKKSNTHFPAEINNNNGSEGSSSVR
jgi:ABC-type sulfate transport system substrate-binding protein